MITRLSICGRLVGICLLVVSEAVLVAAEPPGVRERLALFERIYREQTHAKHLPLLRERLRQVTAEMQTSASEALKQEAAWLTRVIAEGGVDLVELARSLSDASQWPQVEVGSASSTSLSWDLTPQVALVIKPKPAASSVPLVVAVGEIAWRLDRLEPGRYEVIVNYATAAKMESIKLRCALGDLALEQQFSKGQMSSSPRNFRLLRLGVLELTSSMSSATLSLSAQAGQEAAAPALLLRHLLVRKLP